MPLLPWISLSSLSSLSPGELSWAALKCFPWRVTHAISLSFFRHLVAISHSATHTTCRTEDCGLLYSVFFFFSCLSEKKKASMDSSAPLPCLQMVPTPYYDTVGSHSCAKLFSHMRETETCYVNSHWQSCADLEARGPSPFVHYFSHCGGRLTPTHAVNERRKWI